MNHTNDTDTELSGTRQLAFKPLQPFIDRWHAGLDVDGAQPLMWLSVLSRALMGATEVAGQ
jgi:hypothetical protein